MRTLTRENLIDILYGCAILGTGGGGSLEDGIRLIDEALAQGKRFRLATFADLADTDIIGTPYGCGAISPLTEEERQKYARLPEASENFYVLCMKQLEQYLGQELKAVVSTELGGHNTATALYCGAMGDKLILDADPAGRSVPGLQHSTYYLRGIPMCPMSVMNRFGEGAVFTHVFDDERGEDMVRALAVVSQNIIAVMDHVNTAQVLKDAVIHGAITQAETIGHAFLTAKREGGDFVNAVTSAGKGKFMFRGVVTKSAYETRSGYTFGNTEILGTGDFEGHTLKIWYQNENIISWLDDRFYVTVPDLICVFDLDEKMPQLNPYAREGEHVAVTALPAPDAWKSKRGLEVFGPRSFGYEVDYTPFC